MGPEQRELDTSSWRARLKDRARDRLKYYWLCLLLALIALASYMAVLGYQARKPGGEAQYQMWATQEIVWGEDKAMLSIAYPRELRLGSPGEPRPISVWLRRAMPTPGPTPTPTLTPTPTSIPTGTPPPTPTPTCTPRPWVVAFSPHDDGVLFTDREGVPVAPQVALTPGAESAAPAVLYVQRAPLATETSEATLSVSVYGPDGALVSTSSPPLSVVLEPTQEACWRHLWNLLCGGPTAPLLALAATMVAFATKEWQRRSEQEQEERKRQVLAEVERLAHLRSQPTELVLKYWELRERTRSGPDWNDPDVIRRLDAVLEDALSLKDLLAVIGNWFGELDDEKAIRCTQLALSRDKENDTVQAFVCVLNYVQADRGTAEQLSDEKAGGIERALKRIDVVSDEAGKARAARLLRELAVKQGWTKDEKEWEKKAKALAVSWGSLRWLELWPAGPPADPPAVSNWLKVVGLKFNPFGPEAAELDPRLRIYGVDVIFSQARGRRPTLVFGRPGSGKTAAALLLAYYCEDPPSYPREAGGFPVYWSLADGAPADIVQRPYVVAMTDATAQAVGRYLACRFDGFLDLAEPQRYGVARLLSLWAGSREQLEAELRRAGSGLGTSERLVREVTTIYQEVSYEQCLGNFPDLLVSALPAGFKSLYLILDLSAAPINPRATAAMVKNLQQLLDLTIPLAARGVYLKFFLPDSLHPHLGDLSAYEVSTLTWSLDSLATMLQARIRAANGDSLTALCGPDVSREPNLDVRLVQAANGSPRRLVRLGNELLKTHAQRAPDAPKLSAEEIDGVLGPLE